MKPKTISLRRRHLMIAGIAAAATPAAAFAASREAHTGAAAVSRISIARGDTLLVSGRVIDATGKPVIGSRVELIQHGIAAPTDGDGRFVISATAKHASRGVLCRVSGGGVRSRVTYLAFARKHRAARDGIAVLDRDERGTWRTTCGLTVA